MFKDKLVLSIKVDEKVLNSSYERLREYQKKESFVKNVKEEKFQDEFFRSIFEDVLGYSLDVSDPKRYNLKREEKNEVDNKKADGVIVVDGRVAGVIELKSAKTKDLKSIEDQAFGYKRKFRGSRYVITSNFVKIRLYVEDSVDFVEYDLFNLSKEEFRKFYILFSYKSIKEDIPARLKEESLNYEQEITKKFYKDYSNFRIKLFENIVKNNPNIEKLKLLRLTQKLCDRIIFILFAEDTNLLQRDTIRKIRQSFETSYLDIELYDVYKAYFNHIDRGNSKHNIPKYNGGLFKRDDELDSLKIDDDVLDEPVQILSDYDFKSDLGVNILGHIFEQSLTDLEQLQKEVVKDSLKIGKRKRDGIFYTPTFITDYIVQNTLKKVCEAKKSELGFVRFEELKKFTKKEKQKELKKLKSYKEWLLDLKVLDPACGSGAFLNEALDFLLKEVDELNDRFGMCGDLMEGDFIDDNMILQNILYGIDINEDAVEIAKLSLWLKTAHRGKELADLSKNIVCANSLIEKPFGSLKFDVIIGNPPYVRVQGLKSNYEEESKRYEEIYESCVGNYDIYVLFLEMSFLLLKRGGKLGFIVPHKFLVAEYAKGVRGFLAKNRAVEQIVHFGSHQVFKDASTYTCIVTLSHDNSRVRFLQIKPDELKPDLVFDEFKVDLLGNDRWSFANRGVVKVLEKLNRQPLRVKDIFSKIFQGLATSADSVYILEKRDFGYYSKSLDRVVEIEDEFLKPILKGDDVHRYASLKAKNFVIFPYNIKDGKAYPMSEEEIKRRFPLGYEYLKANEKILRGREKGRMGNDRWFLYIYPKSLTEYEQEKLVTPDIAYRSQMSYDDRNLYIKNGAYGLLLKEAYRSRYKLYLAILNSSLMWLYLKNIGTELRGGYFRFNTNYIMPFPLPIIVDFNHYEKNIEKLIETKLNKKVYETTKLEVGMLKNGKKIFMNEFIYAKIRGCLNFNSHKELNENLFFLLPYLLLDVESFLKNGDDGRDVLVIPLEDQRKLLIVLDDDMIISLYVVNSKKLKRQLKNGRFKENLQLGGTANPLTLCKLTAHSVQRAVAKEAFWRQAEELKELYKILKEKSNKAKRLEDLADELLALNKELNEVKERFLKELECKPTKKLREFYNLSEDQFLDELKKAKKIKTKDRLSLRRLKEEFLNLFLEDKESYLRLKSKIEELEEMVELKVFELYDLNEDDIKIIKE